LCWSLAVSSVLPVAGSTACTAVWFPRHRAMCALFRNLLVGMLWRTHGLINKDWRSLQCFTLQGATYVRKGPPGPVTHVSTMKVTRLIKLASH